MSISSGLIYAMPYAIALWIIMSKAFSLCFSVNFFESLIKSQEKPFGSITAAAKTGPNKHPLPASSVPAINS